MRRWRAHCHRTDTGPDANDVDTGPDANDVDTVPDANDVDTGPDANDVDIGPDANDVDTGPDANDVDDVDDVPGGNLSVGAIGVLMTSVGRRRVGLSLVGTATVVCLLLVTWGGLPFLIGAGAALTLQRNAVTGAHLDPPPAGMPENWLIVGGDRRAGALPGAVATGQPLGSRADTILLVAVQDRCAHLVAVPRDLKVRVDPLGEQRLGGLLDYGSPVLVRGVRTALGVPVHHYVQVDMIAVVEGVNALGGVSIDVPVDARDLRTGLALTAGQTRLDGQGALAFVRSRQYEELRDGGWVAQGADDRGRLARQLLLVDSLRRWAAEGMTVGRARALVDAVAPHVSLDRGTGAFEVAELVKSMTGELWSAEMLPTARVIPLEESLSPFWPPHVGTTGAVERTEPSASEALQGLATCGGER